MHKTVLLNETISPIAESAARVVVDCTFGGGGHTRAILEKFPSAQVIGFDQDLQILEEGRTKFASEIGAGRLKLLHANFSQIRTEIRKLTLPGIDALIADLGVSSFQLDRAERGFSFMRAGPLDMRMNPNTDFSARNLVNEWAPEEMMKIFYEYGEERFSRKIVQRIVEARSISPIEDTLTLAKIIEGAVPRQHGKKVIHPATRVFQALRIAVNGELDALSDLLEAIPDILNPGGVASIIAFHSLEDRPVKERFKFLTADCVCPPEILTCARCHKPFGPLTNKKAN